VALHRRIARPGASLTEYGILIGLVAIVGYAGVQMLGSSSSSSLMGSAQGLEENGTLNLIRPKHAKAAAVAEPPSFLASMMPA
ncbi:hypothetical protein, partial [Salmonella enterica]|uniref:hypothetical protein n=1 Tax=Salmonella enterica TaxID=28901 RepID=UPI003D26ADB6